MRTVLRLSSSAASAGTPPLEPPTTDEARPLMGAGGCGFLLVSVINDDANSLSFSPLPLDEISKADAALFVSDNSGMNLRFGWQTEKIPNLGSAGHFLYPTLPRTVRIANMSPVANLFGNKFIRVQFEDGVTMVSYIYNGRSISTEGAGHSYSLQQVNGGYVITERWAIATASSSLSLLGSAILDKLNSRAILADRGNITLKSSDGASVASAAPSGLVVTGLFPPVQTATATRRVEFHFANSAGGAYSVVPSLIDWEADVAEACCVVGDLPRRNQ